MGALSVINLVMTLLQTLLGSLGPNTAYAEVTSSVRKALQEMENARAEVLTRTGLESLRTKPQW